MTGIAGENGLHATGLAVGKIGWFFRPQPVLDQGVDAIVEDVDVVEAGNARMKPEGTGRLLALQIKDGDSWFDRPTGNGWWFRFGEDHFRRWMNLAIPIVVVLVDPETDVCYWQEISPDTVENTGKGYKVEVPRTQTVRTAADAWRLLASKAAVEAPVRYESSLEQLPASVVKLARNIQDSNRLDAALLAHHLAEGRHNPRDTAQALLTARPLWLTRQAPMSWGALGGYANGHEEHSLAGHAYQLAAESSDLAADRARWWVNAAIALMYVDRDRARAAIVNAEEADASAETVALLKAVHMHPEGDASAIEVPELVWSEAAHDNGLVQSFLAIQAQRRGNTTDALRHSVRGLEIAPDDAAVMEQHAETLLWAAVMGDAHPDLRNQGIDLLEKAINERRRWNGPILKLTLELARAYMVDGRPRMALTVCLPAPDGTADGDVAGDGEVMRLALAAAAASGRRALAGEISSRLDDVPTSQLARFRSGLIDATVAEREQWLRADMDDALELGDHGRALRSAFELAQIGIDVSARLKPLIERSLVPEDESRFLPALATASRDLETGLPALRSLARTDTRAATVLIELLDDHGRCAEALVVCDQTLSRRRERAVEIIRVQLLMKLNDPRAEQEALALASRLDSAPTVHAQILMFAARKAVDRADFDAAERHLQTALGLDVLEQDATAWSLIEVQAHIGRFDRARETIERCRPVPRSVEDGKLWVQVHAATRLDAETASEALRLAEWFNDPEVSTALLGLIISSTDGTDPTEMIDATSQGEPEGGDFRRPKVAADLHRRAFAALGKLVDEHGDATGMQTIEGDPEQQLKMMVELMKDRAEHGESILEVAQQAQDGRFPIGVFAALVGKGFATVLVERTLGYLPASSPIDDEHDAEVEVALLALSGTVVADASALLTASGLERDLVAQFSSVTLPPGGLRDIFRADSDVRGLGAGPGRLHLDRQTQQPVFVPLQPDEYLRRLRRTDSLLGLAKTLTPRSPSAPSRLSEIGDEPSMAAWREPVDLAHELGAPLWSDDLSTRRVARELGIPAFGTPSLLVALNEGAIECAESTKMLEVADQAAAEMRSLARDGLVDLRLGPGDMKRIAQIEGWQPGAAALLITRKSWWHWSPDAMDELVELFDALREKQPDKVAHWQWAAMLGAGRAITDPSRRLHALCILCFLGMNYEDPERHLGEAFDQARQVADELGLPDPANAFAAAVETMRQRTGEGDAVVEAAVRFAVTLQNEDVDASMGNVFQS